MCHLRREINHNLQLVAYGLNTTETTKVQEWILEELRIVDRQRLRIYHENLHGIFYWIGLTYINQ